MEQETERFITKVEKLFKLRQVSITEFESLIKEWGQLISVRCYEKDNTKQTYLNLNHLKLTVQWFKQQYCSNKSEHLQDFLQYLIQYISIELQSLTIHPEIKDGTHEIKETQNDAIRWTASKRSLIELICALDEAKCINKGNISTQKIVVHFGELFDVNLDNYYSEINKMALRKPVKDNDQRAYFLNDLVVKFNDKMLNLK
jgi:hypothetical protein